MLWVKVPQMLSLPNVLLFTLHRKQVAASEKEPPAVPSHIQKARPQDNQSGRSPCWRVSKVFLCLRILAAPCRATTY